MRGGNGLIGSKLVARIRDDGQEPLAADLDSGINAYIGVPRAASAAFAWAAEEVMRRLESGRAPVRPRPARPGAQ